MSTQPWDRGWPESPHRHDWLFWGDDPYLVCECGEIRDALTGRTIATGDAAALAGEA